MSARITGVGTVTALGTGIDALWTGALAGRTGLAAPLAIQLPDVPGVVVGEALGAMPAVADRALALARAAVAEALAGRDVSGDRTALIMSTTKGGIGLAQHAMEALASPEVLHRFPIYELGAQLARDLGVSGPVQTVSVACASGTTALGHALRLLEQGRANRALVVGADALSEFVVRGFSTLRALAKDIARPFDAERTGLCVGEAGAAMLLEAGDGARMATLAGYGGGNDCNHITGPARDGIGLQRALKAALAHAGLKASDIAAVSAHGTATRFNDGMEGHAYDAVLGGRRVPVHSIKGAIGHTLGAAGLVEAALCVMGIREGRWPPIAGLQTPDPTIPLSVVHGAPVALDSGVIVSSSSGFSGINSAVILCP
jgi:3-oxoacyl-[acyl-carrier-protein] synthase II